MEKSSSVTRLRLWQKLIHFPQTLTVKGRFGLIVGLLLAAAFGLLRFSSWQTWEPRVILPSLLNMHRKLACTTWPTDTTALGASWPFPVRPTSSVRPNVSKPSDVKVVALIFYGRREYIDILDCYLRRDLVSNNGLIDEVHFVDNARDHKDSKWLDALVDSVPEYRKFKVPKRCESSIAWTGCLWDIAADRNTLYLKIDDDMLYMHQDAISSMVQTRLKNKDAFLIGANVVNVRQTGLMHLHNSAIHPYFPEQGVTQVQEAKVSWRASELPTQSGQGLEAMTVEAAVAMKPPFNGHRWLRLSGNDSDILKTPIVAVEEHSFDRDVRRSWAIDAQQQYSLLENLEKNQLDRYHVGGEDGVWHAQYRRYNINFIAVWGSDIADHLPFDREKAVAIDEYVLTVEIPIETGRPVLIDSRALAMHFTFQTQNKVRTTDLLDRWRAYANEMVCDRPRKPFGKPCKGVPKAQKPH